jgi:hypothetical protein
MPSAGPCPLRRNPVHGGHGKQHDPGPNIAYLSYESDERLGRWPQQGDGRLGRWPQQGGWRLGPPGWRVGHCRTPRPSWITHPNSTGPDKRARVRKRTGDSAPDDLVHRTLGASGLRSVPWQTAVGTGRTVPCGLCRAVRPVPRGVRRAACGVRRVRRSRTAGGHPSAVCCARHRGTRRPHCRACGRVQRRVNVMP